MFQIGKLFNRHPLLESNVLRAMDALHIAGAIEWGAQNFVSSDKQQIKAAKKAGLSVTIIMNLEIFVKSFPSQYSFVISKESQAQSRNTLFTRR